MKLQFIKTATALLSVVAILLFFSCEKSDQLKYNDVTGTYVGTLTSNLVNRSSVNAVPEAATVVVSNVGDQIQVHCFTENFDTTIMLDTYNHNDSVMVCLTGDEFENTYGHTLRQGQMNGGMMGDMQNNETEWMHHLNDEHQDGDEHFGGFDLQHHAFDYTFRMSNSANHFQGVKN